MDLNQWALEFSVSKILATVEVNKFKVVASNKTSELLFSTKFYFNLNLNTTRNQNLPAACSSVEYENMSLAVCHVCCKFALQD